MSCKMPNLTERTLSFFVYKDIYKALCVCVCAICESSDTKSVIDTIVNKWGYTQHKLADNRYNRYIKLIEKMHNNQILKCTPQTDKY